MEADGVSSCGPCYGRDFSLTLCEEKSGGNILCLRLSGLGDIVHALSALSRLRQCRPHAHIAWVVEDRWRAIRT